MPISEVFGLEEGSLVTVKGWVYRKRELKDKVFVVLRDSTGILQVVFSRGSAAFEDAQRLNIESSVAVTGVLKRDPRAPGGVELHASRIDWMYVASHSR